FVGTVMVFFTQHVLGLYGMPRRVYDYMPLPEYIVMNQIASVGAMIIGVSMALWIFNMIYSSAKGKEANMDDPWNLGGKYYFPYQAKTPHH
ncbi:MAG: cbb3-type cytochrome c oxidase subunit I, partial [Candidatus Nitrosotenuis sp.]